MSGICSRFLISLALLLAASSSWAWPWSKTEEPAKAPAPAVDTGKNVQEQVDAAVKAATEQAMKELAERTAAEIAAAKAEVEKAKAEAETAKKEADEKIAAAKAEADEKAKDAEAEKKEKAEAEEAAKKARAEAKAEEKEARAERLEDLKHIDTRIFRLSHASANEVAENFNRMWSGDFGANWKVTKMAIAFPESNSIMVTAPRLILQACEKSLRDLDVEAPQVYIEARFVELGNQASHKVGIDWSMLNGMGGSMSLGGGYQGYHVGKGVKDYKKTLTSKGETTTFSLQGADSTGTSTASGFTGDSDATITYFNGTLNFSQMALTLKALDGTQDAKTFSNPKIIVSSGKKATVDMTKKYPNVKISAKRTDSSGSQSLDIASSMEAIPGEDKFMFAKESFFSWGISLDVTPRIGTNGLINVEIVPTISSQTDWVDTGTNSEDGNGTVSAKYPVIDVKRLVTEFNLESGSTAVIGGLSVSSEEQVDTGIPVLRKIPWIGPRLFGSMERVKTQKEIIVFVTVGIINPRRIEADAGLPKNAILGRQYLKGQKLEPGDRPEKNMEGYESLDMRPLEEQAQDPLRQQRPAFTLKDYIPFRKDPEYRKTTDK